MCVCVYTVQDTGYKPHTLSSLISVNTISIHMQMLFWNMLGNESHQADKPSRYDEDKAEVSFNIYRHGVFNTVIQMVHLLFRHLGLSILNSYTFRLYLRRVWRPWFKISSINLQLKSFQLHVNEMKISFPIPMILRNEYPSPPPLPDWFWTI